MPTTWTSPNKSSSTWSNDNKATVEKAILTEDSFVLLREDGTYLLQEDTRLDWISNTRNTPQGIWNSATYPWLLSNPWALGGEIDWSSPNKN